MHKYSLETWWLKIANTFNTSWDLLYVRCFTYSLISHLISQQLSEAEIIIMVLQIRKLRRNETETKVTELGSGSAGL